MKLRHAIRNGQTEVQDPSQTPETSPCALVRNLASNLRSQFRSGDFKNSHSSFPNLANLALTEAEALACQTGYGFLFFPELAAEKIRKLEAWRDHQKSLPKNLWDRAFAE